MFEAGFVVVSAAHASPPGGTDVTVPGLRSRCGREGFVWKGKGLHGR
jgi:hypothetical protein